MLCNKHLIYTKVYRFCWGDLEIQNGGLNLTSSFVLFILSHERQWSFFLNPVYLKRITRYATK